MAIYANLSRTPGCQGRCMTYITLSRTTPERRPQTYFFSWAQFSNPSRKLCVIVTVIVIVGWAEPPTAGGENHATGLGWAGSSLSLLLSLSWAGLGWAEPPTAGGENHATGLSWAGLSLSLQLSLSWAGLGDRDGRRRELRHQPTKPSTNPSSASTVWGI